MTRPNKLEGLSLETLSSQVLEYEARPEPTQLEHLSDASFLGKLLVLLATVRLDWKVITRYKHSSLFGFVVSNKGKMLYNIDTWRQYFKTLFSTLMKRQNKLERLFLANLYSLRFIYTSDFKGQFGIRLVHLCLIQ